MLDLNQIRSQFPPFLQTNPRNFLREYLQYKILESLFAQRTAVKLTFIGGTAVRIIHNSQRFSEDLDFDSKNLTADEFESLIANLEKELTRLGLHVSIRIVTRDAFHAYIKFSEILYDLNLSPLREEMLHIRIDSFDQGVDYTPSIVTLDKFDVYQNIRVAPADILLAMKLVTILSRKRAKGRDYFDASFLTGKGVMPDLPFLRSALQVQTITEVQELLIAKINTIDLAKMAADVAPFLFKPQEKQRVVSFHQSIELLSQK
jgi:predicted nucleotidyltransferase component of viral defense system